MQGQWDEWLKELLLEESQNGKFGLVDDKNGANMIKNELMPLKISTKWNHYQFSALTALAHILLIYSAAFVWELIKALFQSLHAFSLSFNLYFETPL